jgi:hypothetical protein
VVLAEGGGAVAVLLQDLRERRDALRSDRRVARETRRQLHDGARVVHVMIAACEQRNARGLHSAVVVEAVVAQPLAAIVSSVGMWIGPAERARCAEADVVDQHDHDVRRAVGRLDFKSRRGRRISRVQFLVCGD